MDLNEFLLWLAAHPEELNADLGELAKKHKLGPEALRLLENGSVKQIKVQVELELQIDEAATPMIWVRHWPPH